MAKGGGYGHCCHSQVEVRAASALVRSVADCEIEEQRKSCDFRPDITVEDRLVIGTATARCRVPPDIHDFTLTMQLLDNRAEWKFWGKDESTEIPRPGRPVTLKVKRTCVPGRYRVIGKATGVLEGNNFSFTDQDVEEVFEDEWCRR